MNFFSFFEKLNIKLSNVGQDKFFKNDLFEWISDVEGFHEVIKAEYLSIGRQETQLPSLQELSNYKGAIKADAWKALFLYSSGQRLIREGGYFQETYRVLQKIPGLKTAFFSVLPAGSVIPPHRGPYNGVLRFHLGISIPAGDCAISVGDEIYSWTEGKGVVFDDSYIHSAWNRTENTRVVLFVDFLRPLPIWYKYLNEAFHKKLCKEEFRVNFHKNAEKSVDKFQKK